jgi:peptide/nickel transport system ATP-binding protein
MTNLLEVDDLSVMVGRGARSVAAVSHASLQLDRGEVVGLVGESGAGKTILARAVTGLLPASARASGSVRLDGTDVLTMNDEALRHHRGAGAALCFQSPRRALSPFRRVGGQIEDRFDAHLPAGVTATAAPLLASVGIRDPERRSHAYAHELSGGMAQRVMIALALACYPELLVADEPTTGLDVTLTKSILALLRRAADEDGRGVLVISHDVAAIAEVCDRIVVMYGGCVVEDGATAPILAAPAHPYTAALLDAVPDVARGPRRALGGMMPQFHEPPTGCPFTSRCPLVEERCHDGVPGMRELGDVRVACVRAGEAGKADPVTAAMPGARASTDAGDPVLVIEQLEVVHGARFGRRGHRALRGVSLEVRAGETVGVVGESGCGKTTLARAALGLIPARSGRVRFEGQDLAGLSRGELRQLRRRMQMVFQDPVDTLDPRRTVAQTLEDSLRAFGLDAAERDARILEALATVGLDPVHRERRRHELSGGQAQRVGIARALLLDPDLVVFDEPTSALDVTIQAQILELIAELMQRRHRAYLYVSHDLATVRSVSDRLVVLYLGTVVEEGRTDVLYSRPLHPYTRALLSGVPSLHGSAVAASVELKQDLDDSGISQGCVLASRCPFATGRCASEPQTLAEYGPGHRAACWRIPEIT